MIQMLAAVVVCAAMTRFVFLGLTEEGEQAPTSSSTTIPPRTLRELEGSIELDMAKRPKPDFVVVVANSDTRVELPPDFDPKPQVAWASAKDLIFCARQESDAPRATSRNRLGHRAAPAAPPASPTSPHDELFRFLAYGHSDEAEEPAAAQHDDGDELDDETATNLGRGEPPKKRLEDGSGATVWPGAAKESEIPNFKGSDLGRFPLVSADSWTSDHHSERSRSADGFFGMRARGTLTLKRR